MLACDALQPNDHAKRIRSIAITPMAIRRTSPEVSKAADRIWWQSRAWLYRMPVRSAVALETSSAQSPLRNNTRQERRSTPVPAEVAQTLLRGTFHKPSVFSYVGRTVAVRPMGARLLSYVWRNGGRPTPFAEISQHLWGRSTPPCRATLDTTVFRANAALRATGCPLRISCSDGYLEVFHRA
jgi:hypothetical protein